MNLYIQWDGPPFIETAYQPYLVLEIDGSRCRIPIQDIQDALDQNKKDKENNE